MKFLNDKLGLSFSVITNLFSTAKNLHRLHIFLLLFSAIGLLTFTVAIEYSGLWQVLSHTCLGIILSSLLFTILLSIKSFIDFSQSGPNIRQEILLRYRSYTILSFLRLTFWSFLILVFLGGIGAGLYAMTTILFNFSYNTLAATIFSVAAMLLITLFNFLHHLFFIPGSICTSLNYLPSRLYGLWGLLNERRLKIVKFVFTATATSLVVGSSFLFVMNGDYIKLILLLGGTCFYLGLIGWSLWDPEPRPMNMSIPPNSRPNILMIGSDTLRADRIGNTGYPRELSPNINQLAESGSNFLNCHVPCARTAPSLISLLTGTWPSRHGIRDNFSSVDESNLSITGLPTILKSFGYKTAAISDWCGADLGKFSFGFEKLDLPDDQWNLKYLIRQGPKDIRLFLSLFTHNLFGKTLLPEIYYLAGVPLTDHLGRSARQTLSDFSHSNTPFFLNVFFSTTHPPFGSVYPFYTQYSDQHYKGESKFVMARLTDPFEIIRRQQEAKTEFDLEQIIDLYDGCVANFDHETGKLLAHLKDCGLANNTIVVIYSDHGMEFFESGSWGQGNSVLSDASPRVPLIIADPRRDSVKEIEAVVRSIDFVPTILDIIGADTAKFSDIDGTSLLPLIDGYKEDLGLLAYNETGIWLTRIPSIQPDHLHYPDLVQLLEVADNKAGTLTIKPEYQQLVVQAKDLMVKWKNWKLVYFPMKYGTVVKLFDTRKDISCTYDLSDSEPAITHLLKTALERFIEGHELTLSPSQPD